MRHTLGAQAKNYHDLEQQEFSTGARYIFAQIRYVTVKTCIFTFTYIFYISIIYIYGTQNSASQNPVAKSVNRKPEQLIILDNDNRISQSKRRIYIVLFVVVFFVVFWLFGPFSHQPICDPVIIIKFLFYVGTRFLADCPESGPLDQQAVMLTAFFSFKRMFY